jgi:hypothetical protein
LGLLGVNVTVLVAPAVLLPVGVSVTFRGELVVFLEQLLAGCVERDCERLSPAGGEAVGHATERDGTVVLVGFLVALIAAACGR